MLINSTLYLPILTIYPLMVGIFVLIILLGYWSQTHYPKFNKRNVLKLLFAFYITCVAQLTNSINIYTPWTYLRMVRAAHGFGYFDDIEWHPLAMYKSIYTATSQYTIIGNIIMLVPLTFFVCILWKNTASLKKMFILAIFTSLTIETSQLILSYFYLEHRLFDLNDLLQNTLGGLLGYALFILVQRTLPKFVHHAQQIV